MKEQKFFEFVAETFGVSVETLNMDTSYENEPEWTSLTHLCLIVGMYEEFGVDIPVEEANNVRTLGQLYSYLNR